MIGRTIPDVTLKTRVRDETVVGDNPFRWQDLRVRFEEPGINDEGLDDDRYGETAPHKLLAALGARTSVPAAA